MNPTRRAAPPTTSGSSAARGWPPRSHVPADTAWNPSALRAMAALLLLRDKVAHPLIAAASTPRREPRPRTHSLAGLGSGRWSIADGCGQALVGAICRIHSRKAWTTGLPSAAKVVISQHLLRTSRWGSRTREQAFPPLIWHDNRVGPPMATPMPSRAVRMSMLHRRKPDARRGSGGGSPWEASKWGTPPGRMGLATRFPPTHPHSDDSDHPFRQNDHRFQRIPITLEESGGP